MFAHVIKERVVNIPSLLKTEKNNNILTIFKYVLFNVIESMLLSSLKIQYSILHCFYLQISKNE